MCDKNEISVFNSPEADKIFEDLNNEKYYNQAELQDTFRVDKPKLIFCLNERTADIEKPLSNLNLEANIVSFDKGQYGDFAAFLEKYGEDAKIEDYKPKDFDPDDTLAFLVATSGTTGVPKSAALSHKNMAILQPYTWSRFTNFPTPTRLAMIFSAAQWLTALILHLGSVMVRFTRLQSSRPVTPEHAYYLINKYRPTFTVLSPTIMAILMRPGQRDNCDLTCFEVIMLVGSAVQHELIQEIHKISPTTEALNVYGISEVSGVGFQPEYSSSGPGKQVGCYQYRIVDITTKEDIREPNVPGELWIKGDGIFKGYYNNPTATEETFAEGRWFKTGDLFYRDEHWNYFFVERIKLLLKYKNHQISPVELETVIKKHLSVSDAVVTGIEDTECGELPVACVVRRSGCDVTAQEIKDLVKESLTESKQLRGGVIFLKELPLTTSTKVDRRRLRELAAVMPRE